jgi:type II secretory pathway pseudopilin PulG
VLVALLILSITLVAALQLVGGSLRLARTSADHVAATLLAGSLMSEATQGPLEVGTTEGTEGAFRWMRQVALDPGRLPFGADEPKTERIRLARVSVEVRWGQGRRFELVTLRAWASAS